ncbi:CoA transferase [Neobacillus sp. 114]|uniref:CaiB/BaiF CoA transferase family protein n=1 Tax=Neobacillus sp. 114 TaxID=3048535 RepID=UPI0024C3E502|nr:CoA transferase [Neobacillus sp. 114]
MTLPLKNVRVLELAQTLAGPFAGQMLSDLGAEVIKVEKMSGDETRHFTPPEWDGESTFYMANNRNKRSITLDLKSEEGINIVKKLAKESHVIIENFRTGTAERLGFGYEAIKEINPSIIYLSISGFGRTGPFKDKAGYDLMIQAYSGLMGLTGEIGRPPVKAGFSVVDLVTGTLGAMSVVTALLQRDKTGIGQYLDCSLLDSQVMMMNYLVPAFQATGVSPKPMGAGHPSLYPYQAFRAQDQYVVVACANDRLWVKLCKALGWEDLLEFEKFKRNKDRVAYKEELEAILNERFSEWKCADIVETLEANGVPCSPINSVEQVIHSEQVIARETIKDIPHPFIKGLRAPVFPVKFSDMDITVRSHPPGLGEHTSEILKEIGYTPEEIINLAEQGVAGKTTVSII